MRPTTTKISQRQFCSVDRALDHREAQLFLQERHEGGARDPLEDVVGDGGRDDRAVADHEEIRDGAFGDVAVLVQRDRIVEAGSLRVRAREGGIDVGPGDLPAGRDHVVIDALPG